MCVLFRSSRYRLYRYRFHISTDFRYPTLLIVSNSFHLGIHPILCCTPDMPEETWSCWSLRWSIAAPWLKWEKCMGCRVLWDGDFLHLLCKWHWVLKHLHKDGLHQVIYSLCFLGYSLRVTLYSCVLITTIFWDATDCVCQLRSFVEGPFGILHPGIWL